MFVVEAAVAVVDCYAAAVVVIVPTLTNHKQMFQFIKGLD